MLHCCRWAKRGKVSQPRSLIAFLKTEDVTTDVREGSKGRHASFATRERKEDVQKGWQQWKAARDGRSGISMCGQACTGTLKDLSNYQRLKAAQSPEGSSGPNTLIKIMHNGRRESLQGPQPRLLERLRLPYTLHRAKVPHSPSNFIPREAIKIRINIKMCLPTLVHY